MTFTRSPGWTKRRRRGSGPTEIVIACEPFGMVGREAATWRRADERLVDDELTLRDRGDRDLVGQIRRVDDDRSAAECSAGTRPWSGSGRCER